MGLILNTAREEIVGALPPPPGVIPNFEHPESLGYRVVIATAVLFPLATFVLCLRIYTRAKIVCYMGPDDYAVILAWIFLVAYVVISFIFNLGLGVHLWNIPLTTFMHFLKLGAIEGVFYGLSFLSVKVSILLLYLRLSPYRPFRIAVWVVMIATIVYSILGSFEFLFNCQPIAKNWDVTLDGKCIDVTKILMTHGSLTIVTDIAMLILPITLVRKLKLPLKQKVALAGLFMTGTLVCIVSGIRLKTIADLIRSPDFTWVGADNSVWTIMEMCIGVICACLPTFKPFLRRHFPKLIGSSYHSETYGPYSGKRTTNTVPTTSTGGYELDSREGRWKSGLLRTNKQQTVTHNESQECWYNIT
ncbi:hypothetical protein B0O99DRAFT_718424 [Bisporella sp. PMI_857]|nr:hypothetical protein B0O99DRAFT_718424 [Bisporella sp. PMI_857]